ncbi:hypothetical protein U0070_026954 [Myodes glareolus]|uniref:Cytosolic iron-sulfur assembly component 2A n=1 Tax=Myodes glareolus TaxID=447135 RepID=A0AAW0K0S7_MYOGA
MERVSGLLSWTLSRVLWLSGFSEQGAARQPRTMEEKALEVYDLIRTIRDPEKPNTLEELEVVTESCVEVQEINEEDCLLEIYISEGTHSTEEDINKQINDKERVAAAMENPNLREIVEQCVLEPD